MQRRKPLRPTPLRADAEKRREFLQRGRRELERKTELVRSELKTRGGLRRASAAEGPLTPAQWREAAFVASGGRCVITGRRAREVDDRSFVAHHMLAKRILRGRGLLGYVWDARNALWLDRDAHDRHESPGVSTVRISSEKLPGSVWAFCAELDALEGSAWATETVLRGHPTQIGGCRAEGAEG